MSLYFVDDRLEYFQGDFIPSSVNSDEQAAGEEGMTEQVNSIEAEAVIQSVDDAGAGDEEESDDGILQIRIKDDEGNQQRVN
jgi:hypothetical protein